MEATFEIINASGDKEDVHVYGSDRDGFWYVVNNGIFVNKTYDEIYEGMNIEDVHDEEEECFTWKKPITDIEELALAVIS